MKRLLIETVEGERAFLNDNEVHHLVKVLRAHEGELFDGVDGHGKRLHCALRRDSDGWYGEVLSTWGKSDESPLKVTLGQALIKKDKFEWVIQKTVELGVTRIVPIVSERTEIRLKDQREERKMRRWSRILEEAVKQSGRSLIPELSSPILLGDLLKREANLLCIVLDEEGGASLIELAREHANLDSCMLLVGPEGGWGQRDRELFAAHSTVSLHLGPRILRTETASVAALSLLQYEFGDLG